MNLVNALLVFLVAALFEFSLPLTAALLVLYLASLAAQGLLRYWRWRQRRAVVRAAVAEPWGQAIAQKWRRIPGERTTVVILPRQRDGQQ